MTMANSKMIEHVTNSPGFIAALDQSGGSTAGALKLYGIADAAYSSEAEMFRLMHEMRSRIMTAPAFNGSRVIAAILFEQTMDGAVNGRPAPACLWEERHVVPFVKVDKGLQPEASGVCLMKPVPDLDALLRRAVTLGVAGTKMRSTIRLADREGIAAAVRQQFEFGERILAHDLLPILEPEVLIASPDKEAAETLLRDALARGLDALPGDHQIMLKLSIPETPKFYRSLIGHPRVARVVALSGGYDRHLACRKLMLNDGLIGSFSRALLQDLRHPMTDAEFDAALAAAADEIYHASVGSV
jgi:fructose-bisphosphate aldolase class I